MLQLSEVVEACCNFLMKQLHPSNCIGIRQFADAQGCSDLYKVANNYVMVSATHDMIDDSDRQVRANSVDQDQTEGAV